jgi:hypothetical protein
MNKTLDLLIDEEISKASSDLLLKESFYPLVLAGMPRAVSGRVLSAAVGWSVLYVKILAMDLSGDSLKFHIFYDTTCFKINTYLRYDIFMKSATLNTGNQIIYFRGVFGLVNNLIIGSNFI